jgi:16S rRNA (guanine(966)-N(2))-methyltransferase RsmD
MRIITGTLKGRQLEAPLDQDIRPTADRCKESMFNILEVRKGVRGTRILDLFAGTGNLGFEAISRGAASVVSVDKSPESARLVTSGARHFKIESQISFIKSDVEKFLKNTPPTAYDVVFADPPYDWPALPELPDKIIEQGWLTADGWFFLEHDARHKFVDHPNCVFTKPYGRTIVSIFREIQTEPDESGHDHDASTEADIDQFSDDDAIDD